MTQNHRDISDLVPESWRRVGASVIMWGGWIGCISLTAYDVVNYNEIKPDHLPPAWLGLTIVILIGVGIAGALARSRMRLTDTIVEALRTGMKSQRDETDRLAREALENSINLGQQVGKNSIKLEEYREAIEESRALIAEVAARKAAKALIKEQKNDNGNGNSG